MPQLIVDSVEPADKSVAEILQETLERTLIVEVNDMHAIGDPVELSKYQYAHQPYTIAVQPVSTATAEMIRITEEIREKLGVKPGDTFHIMGLPTQLISNSISFLEMEDRLRARVNKRLDAIELNCKYHVEKMIIEEKSMVENEGDEDNSDEEKEEHNEDEEIEQEGNIDEEDEDEDENEEDEEEEEKFDQRITFYKEKSYSSDCIRRLTQNVSIGCLKIKLTGSKEFHREIFNLLTEFDIRDLYLDSKDNDILKEMMTDTFFLDLKNSYSIHLAGDFAGITSDALHTLYKNMMERSIKLRKFSNFDLLKEKCISFLKLIGITYRNGEFFSNRDIEVFNLGGAFYSIFDGNSEIVFTDTPGLYSSCFNFQLIESHNSLDEAKNVALKYFDRIDVSPE